MDNIGSPTGQGTLRATLLSSSHDNMPYPPGIDRDSSMPTPDGRNTEMANYPANMMMSHVSPHMMTLKEQDFKALANSDSRSPKINGSATFKIMNSGTSTAMMTKASPTKSKGLSPANYMGFNGTNSSFALANSIGSPGLMLSALRSSEGRLEKTVLTSPKATK